MQDSNPESRVSGTESQADWMPADKPTELSMTKLKSWTQIHWKRRLTLEFILSFDCLLGLHVCVYSMFYVFEIPVFLHLNIYDGCVAHVDVELRNK